MVGSKHLCRRASCSIRVSAECANTVLITELLEEDLTVTLHCHAHWHRQFKLQPFTHWVWTLSVSQSHRDSLYRKIHFVCCNFIKITFKLFFYWVHCPLKYLLVDAILASWASLLFHCFFNNVTQERPETKVLFLFRTSNLMFLSSQKCPVTANA